MDKDFTALGHDVTIHPVGAGLRELERGGGSSVMTPERLANAVQTLQDYQRGKETLDNRIVENEKWYKMRHWEYIRKKSNSGSNAQTLEPASAWLFNSLANKHADAMDNYPAPNILPREHSDEGDAKQLTSIVPVVLERNDFEDVYSRAWWYKLKSGTVAYGVFWDQSRDNGLGDIVVKKADLLNLFWKPGVTDVQDSPNLFHVYALSPEEFNAKYPDLQNVNTSIKVKEYAHDDNLDTSKNIVIVEWYYKMVVPETQQMLLHYCEFVGDKVLYCSEDDDEYAQRGFYDHGRYPYVFDVLFPDEDTAAGFGYIDVMKEPQLYIDKLDQIIMMNACRAGKSRFMMNGGGNINEEEFSDWSNDIIHCNGGVDDRSLREFKTAPLPAFVVNHKMQKIDELKETSGNRDFSQGSSAGGVTAAAAISALQEAGNKLSRDMIKGSYRAYRNICYMVIELIRQFYDEARCFRITGEAGAIEYLQYSNANIAPQQLASAYPDAEPSYRKPIFDITVKPQKANPFQREAQNEFAVTLYKLGFFDPARAEQSLAALELMEFDGKDKVVQSVSQNAQMFQMMQQLVSMMGTTASTTSNDPASVTGGMGAQTMSRATDNATTPYAQKLADRAKPDINKSGVRT